MAARERKKGFFFGNAVRQIGLEQFLNRLRRVLRLEVAVDLLPDIGIGPESSAGEQVIALDRVIALADGHFGGDQADVAVVVGGEGVMAAGSLIFQWRVDRAAPVAPVADRSRVTLGVGGGELA